MGRKPCGKRRNCLLQAISPFSCSVFKRLVLQTCKNQGLFGKELTPNSLPNHKIIGLSKLKAFADDNLNMAQKLKNVVENVENIVEKGNCCLEHIVGGKKTGY